MALDDFVTNRLPQFGDWQDAMKTGAPTLFHALVSTSVNAGLLDPRLAVQAAEAGYADRGRRRLTRSRGSYGRSSAGGSSSAAFTG